MVYGNDKFFLFIYEIPLCSHLWIFRDLTCKYPSCGRKCILTSTLNTVGLKFRVLEKSVTVQDFGLLRRRSTLMEKTN